MLCPEQQHSDLIQEGGLQEFLSPVQHHVPSTEDGLLKWSPISHPHTHLLPFLT